MTRTRRTAGPWWQWHPTRLRARTSSMPLLALLPRQLTEAEVRLVADRLERMSRATGSVPDDDGAAGAQIMRITDDLPRGPDLEAVSRELARRAAHTHPRVDLDS